MAYSNQTTHYGLPLPTGADKSSWLDFNEAFEAVDAALYAAANASGSSGQAIEALQQAVSALQSALTSTNANLTQEVTDRTAGDSALNTRVAGVEGVNATQTSQIGGLQDDMSTIDASFNELLEDLTFQGVTLTPHANLSKTNISATTSGVELVSNSIMHKITPFMVQNTSDNTVSMTGGVARSDGNYVVPFYTVPKTFMDAHYSHLEALHHEVLTRAIYWKHAANVNDNLPFAPMNILIMKRTDGTGVIGVGSTSTSYDFTARRQIDGLGALMNKDDAYLPSEV